MDIDYSVRIAAFNWLSEQVAIHGDVLPRKLLERGFFFNDVRVPLSAPQGIFKPFATLSTNFLIAEAFVNFSMSSPKPLDFISYNYLAIGKSVELCIANEFQYI